MLLIKGTALLAEAKALRPGGAGPWLAGAAGLAFGALKARFLFAGSLKKNLERIAALKEPRIWQFFRARFLLILAVVIILSARFSRLAHGNYPLLIVMGTLDFSISLALLGSSPYFFKKKAFGKF